MECRTHFYSKMLRIGIHGFGRIGRSVLRAIYENHLEQEFQIVAINELAEAETIAHLLKYDSTHGQFPKPVSLKNSSLLIGNSKIELLQIEHEFSFVCQF